MVFCIYAWRGCRVLSGCADAASVQKTQAQNSQKIGTRGIIMVGMPVHQHDYQLVYEHPVGKKGKK